MKPETEVYRVKERPWECSLVEERQKRFKKAEMQEPSLEELIRWWESGYCLATDGCVLRGTRKDMEGRCGHGHVSWLRYLDMCDSRRDEPRSSLN